MSEQTTVLIGEREYELVKTGLAQADQVSKLAKWVGTHGKKVLSNIQSKGNVTQETGFDLVFGVLADLDTESILDLFIVVTGCTREEAVVYFDVSILIDSIIVVYNKQPALRKLADRFFSNTNSEDITVEQSIE